AWSAPVTFKTPFGPIFLQAGDFDGKNGLDLITVNSGSDSVSVFLNNGNGGFGGALTAKAGGGALAVALADFDKDGKLDAAVADSFDDAVMVLLGSGMGTFSSQKTAGVGFSPYGIT